ncbi:MAG: hypothetical protein JST59_01900 [Actinobacteria bacterium]|nr:hypothetical protein [Actinomycetota bacterium]
MFEAEEVKHQSNYDKHRSDNPGSDVAGVSLRVHFRVCINILLRNEVAFLNSLKVADLVASCDLLKAASRVVDHRVFQVNELIDEMNVRIRKDHF